jgi:hypothetical protein
VTATISARGRNICWLVVWLCCSLSAATLAAAERPSATTILRRADQVRNPYLGIALGIDLSVVSAASGRELRSSRYIMLTHRNDRTLMLMQQKDRTAPGALLIADDSYWLLPAQAERPVEQVLLDVVAGDLSHAGFLRVNLRLRYEPRYDGEERLGDEPCWRLELEPKSQPAPFGRVRYWVAQRSFLPMRIEFYAETGELLKTVRFTGYQDTGVGPRPARIEIEDSQLPDERATLTMGKPRGVRTTKLEFDQDALTTLRDAAQRLAVESEAPINGRQLVDALWLAQLSRAQETGRPEVPSQKTAEGAQ